MKITLEDTKRPEEDQDLSAKDVLPQDLSPMEDTRFQWNKMKDRTLKEKLSYFLTYYGITLLIVIASLFILISITRTILSHKDYAFNAMLVNVSSIDSEAIGSDFASYAGIDTEKFTCFIDTNSTLSLTGLGQSDVSTSTKLAASVQAGDVDVIAMDSENYETYALNGIFLDLREVFTPEELSAYEPYLYYMDRTVVERWNSEDHTSALTEEPEVRTGHEAQKALLAHEDPSAMDDPVPVGILISDFAVIRKLNAYQDLYPVLGIVANSENRDRAKAFLSYLSDEGTDTEKIRYVY